MTDCEDLKNVVGYISQSAPDLAGALCFDYDKQFLGRVVLSKQPSSNL